MKWILYSFAMLICGCQAQAFDLELDSTLTKYSWIETLSFDSSLDLDHRQMENHPAQTTFGGVYSHSLNRLPAPDGSPGSVDITDSASASLGYARSRWYEVEVGMNQSSTYAENLKSVGPLLSGGIYLGSADVRLKLGVSLLYNTFWETYDYNALIGKSKTEVSKSGIESIGQGLAKLSGKLYIGDWRFKAWYSVFRYSKDVAGFLDVLNQPKAISTNANAFVSTLQGFYVDGEGALVGHKIGQEWELSTSYEHDICILDGSTSWSSSLTLGYGPGENWHFDIGATHSENSFEIDTGGLFNVSYSFGA